MRIRPLIVYLFGIIVVVFGFGASAESSVGVAKVSSSPPGATVYISGREYGPTPVFIELQPGKHKVMVSLDGYPPKTKQLSVIPGRVSYATVKFKNGKPGGIRVHDTRKHGADAGPGTVNVATDPAGLTVKMNGRKVPRKTPVSFDIGAGAYEMTIQNGGQTLVRKTVFVRAGRTLDLDLVVKHRRRIDEADPWK